MTTVRVSLGLIAPRCVDLHATATAVLIRNCIDIVTGRALANALKPRRPR